MNISNNHDYVSSMRTNRNNQLQSNNINGNIPKEQAIKQETAEQFQNLLTGKAENSANKIMSTNDNTISDSSAITYSEAQIFANYKKKTEVTNTNNDISSSQNVAKMDVAKEKEEQLKQPEVKAAIQELQATEQNVRAHEQVHKAAGAGVTGAISYSYTTGPDGKRYISGGEVSVGTSGGSSPEETLKQLEQVKRAALAPADPSPQDLSVAASTSAQILQVRGELASEQYEELNSDESEKESVPVDSSKEKPLGSIASTVDQTESISSSFDTSTSPSDSKTSVRQAGSDEKEQQQSIEQQIEQTMIERAYSQATSKYKIQMDMAEKGLTQQPMFSHIA